jgi:hypothetical protein
MEGKRDEVLTRRAKARDKWDKKKNEASLTTPSGGPSASGIRRDKSGRAYIVDSVSGQAILLASADDSSMPAMALAAFEPPTDSIYTFMSTADRFEYNALFLDNHSASMNWHERRRSVSANDALVASMNTNTHTNLSMQFGPFILDSGVTIHISPDTSDFFNLEPISPQTIRGVGGSSINATGIGKIHLRIAKGLEITLEPALFVPVWLCYLWYQPPRTL